MSHAPQNPVDTDVPLNNFSHCHAGILRHLDTFGELPALLAPAQAGLTVGEYAPNAVKKAIVGVGHAQQQRDGQQVQRPLRRVQPGADDTKQGAVPMQA